MLRYCTRCEKEYDFPPRAVTGPKPLICPMCQHEIDKNSRRPAAAENNKPEEAVGSVFGGFLRLAYLFYVILAVIGIIGYFVHVDAMLYIPAVITVICYILQLITGTTAFTGGIIFVPLGAVAGYFLLGMQGICLGILGVFLIRHIIRDLFFELIFKLIGLGNKEC